LVRAKRSDTSTTTAGVLLMGGSVNADGDRSLSRYCRFTSARSSSIDLRASPNSISVFGL
jgi:hypothetical protein